MGVIHSRDATKKDKMGRQKANKITVKHEPTEKVLDEEIITPLVTESVKTDPLQSLDSDSSSLKIYESPKRKTLTQNIPLITHSLFKRNSKPENSAIANEKGSDSQLDLSPRSELINLQPPLSKSNFVLDQHDHNLHDEYIIHDNKIGQGTFGSVCQAINKQTGAICAVKTISKSQLKNLDRLRTEIAIMKELDHPNIIKLYETYEDFKNIYLVMELCRGGELFDLIIEKGYFTEKSAAIIMKQIFSALNYMHSLGIMHRDLKPENFLFLNKHEEDSLKIIDFGLSCRFKPGNVCKTKAGTPYYVDPQVLKGHYDQTCDYWSSGVIMYLLLCGYPPFHGETDAEVLKKVRLGNFYFSGFEWKKISQESKELIKKLLKLNPKDRCTAEAALQHPWVLKMTRHDSSSLDTPSTLISNLKSFNTINKLKKAALTVIALHSSQKEINNLKEIFFKLDTDNNGKLSVKEMKEGMFRLGLQDSELDYHQILESLDSNRSGTIDYTEFLAATIDQQMYYNESACRDAFRVFDLVRRLHYTLDIILNC